jgi:hypothetical protein
MMLVQSSEAVDQSIHFFDLKLAKLERVSFHNADILPR